MYLICICKLFPPSFLLPSISYKSNVALQQRHLWSTKRVYPNDEMNIVGKFSLSASKDHPPKKKKLFREFSNIEEVSQIVGKFTKCDKKICCGLSKLTTDFLIFFTKVCFYFKRIVKNTKKIRKNQMTSKTGCPPYNLLRN